MQFVKNENEMTGIVNMKYKLEQGDNVIILSELSSVLSHYIEGTSSKKGYSILYMGDDSLAIKRDGLKTRTTYYYLAKLNGEICVLQTPASLFWDMNTKINKMKREGKKEADKRHYEWSVVKMDNPATGYTDYFAEILVEIADKPTKADIEGNNELLAENLRSYEDMLRTNYHNRYGTELKKVDATPAPKAEEQPALIDGQIPDSINLDDIPF
jgi:hypothetical protein